MISEEVYKTLCKSDSRLNLEPSCTKLRTYTGELIPILGTVQLIVKYKDKQYDLKAEVVKGKTPCLLGRDWLDVIKLCWDEVFQIKTEVQSDVEQILKKYEVVFKKELGTVQGVKAKIYVDSQEKPRYFKSRSPPFALKEKIEHELDRLVREGTVTPVEFSEWATPIVPIVKSDKTVRICGDYKVTVNRVSKLDNYPIPKTEDLFAILGGGEHFSKLDLSKAYQQLELDEESKKYTTINTHKGLFQYNRLPFGISSAPGIFQRTIENLLQGISSVIVRLDDILVTGKTRGEHLQNLAEVLKKLEAAGVRLKREKCVFLADEVTYLGHRINKHGRQPTEDKVQAIKNLPEPNNVKELQAFLGMLNYYGCYLPNLSTVLAPLHELLGKDVAWSWGPKQSNAMQESKNLLRSSSILVHFDSAKKLVMSCDASPTGLGVVLSHITEEGEKPIAYVSRTLAPAEKNYSQLEKEGLAIIFGAKKLHQYLYGHHFVIYTDHKPLLGLFKPDRAIPTMAAARIQRWALILAGYEYEILYKEGKKNGNADCLSRLPLKESVDVPVPGETILLIEHLNSTPVHAEEIEEWTQLDPLLRQVTFCIKNGWKEKNKDEELRPYFSRRNELSAHEGCILWGSRVVIPEPGREKLLDLLHEGHPGIVRMKNLARSYL